MIRACRDDELQRAPSMDLSTFPSLPEPSIVSASDIVCNEIMDSGQGLLSEVRKMQRLLQSQQQQQRDSLKQFELENPQGRTETTIEGPCSSSIMDHFTGCVDTDRVDRLQNQVWQLELENLGLRGQVHQLTQQVARQARVLREQSLLAHELDLLKETQQNQRQDHEQEIRTLRQVLSRVTRERDSLNRRMSEIHHHQYHNKEMVEYPRLEALNTTNLFRCRSVGEEALRPPVKSSRRKTWTFTRLPSITNHTKEGGVSDLHKKPNVCEEGDWMWKHTRKLVGGKRHRRFFWIQPHTKMLYWTHERGGETKNGVIESFYIEEQTSWSQPPTIIIKTSSRPIRVQCMDFESHHAWVDTLLSLLSPDPQQKQPGGPSLRHRLSHRFGFSKRPSSSVPFDTKVEYN
ncbi:hypothetical protein EC973_007918 [Apophysomyces ossiformis]|uniref:Pleckstrin homology domain-containing protein n=1 Tax=Apophysomyces ossiformis TaxID=679940 RepID=A0A8H7EPJ0_9FUNG|nr:hypothetical protein EC973_007918 [Apophysomyces ossiformis]